MSTLSAKRRGDLAEQMLPVAAHLAALVHGDGGPEDVAQTLEGLDDTQKNALIVVLAGLVDPDQPVGKALGWLDRTEHGALTIPAWSEERPIRDLAPDAEDDLGDDYIDQVAVDKFVHGFRLDSFTDAEFLAAVQRCTASGMALADVDRLRRWPLRETEKRVNRLRKQYQRSGREFPSLARPGALQFTAEEIVVIRKKAAAGSTDLELSMSYDVDRETIRSIVTGRRYASAGGPIRAVRGQRGLAASREYMCGHGANSLAARNVTDERKAA